VKVQELIAILQTHSPEALVVLPDTASDFDITEVRAVRAVEVRLLEYKGMSFVQFWDAKPPESERWLKVFGAVDAVILE
jgi:hypothetical protein